MLCYPTVNEAKAELERPKSKSPTRLIESDGIIEKKLLTVALAGPGKGVGTADDRPESQKAFFKERMEMFGKPGTYYGPPTCTPEESRRDCIEADDLFNDVDWSACTDVDPNYDSDYDIFADQLAVQREDELKLLGVNFPNSPAKL